MTNSTPPSSTPPSKTPPASPLSREEKRRKWKRRLIRICIVLVALIAVIRIAVLILAPVIISAAARGLGLQCDYQRLKLSMLGTNASLWGVTIKSLDGKTQVLTADYAHANLNTFALLRLRLVALRLEADGVEVPLDRKPDGTIPLLETLASHHAAKTAPNSSKPGKTNFTLPLEVHALRVHKLAVKVKDETLSPPFEDTIRMDLRVSDFGRPKLPARIEFDASSAALFSNASATAEADIAPTTIKADANLSLRGFRAELLSPYLAAAGISVDDRAIDVRGKGKFILNASTTPGEFQGSASLSDLRVTADSAPVASLSSVNIDIAALSPSLLHLRDVHASKGSLRIERTPEGQTRFAAFSANPSHAPPRPATAKPAPLATPTPSHPPTTQTPTPKTPFAWQADRILATEMIAIFDDRATYPRTQLSLQISKAEAKDLRSDGPPDLTTTFTADLTAPGIVGAIAARASATPFQSAPKATATLAIESIRPEALTPYLRALGIESAIDSAAVKFTANADMKRNSAGVLQSTISIDRTTLKDGDAALFDIGPLKITGLAADPTGRIDIESFEGAGPDLRITRLADGRFELLGLRISPTARQPTTSTTIPALAATSPSHPTTPALPPSFNLPPLHLNSFTWKDVRFRFEDLSTPQEPPIDLTDAKLEIKDILIGDAASSKGSLLAHFRLSGLIDSFDLRGVIETSTTSINSQLTTQAIGLSLARLAPYLKPLGIEPTLANGSFTGHFSAGAARSDTGIRLTASAQDVSLFQPTGPLISVSDAKLNHIDLTADQIAIGPITVFGFKAAASRDSTGVSAAGLKLLPTPAAESTDLAPLPDPLALLASLGKLSLDSLSLNDARFSWNDAATKTPVSTEALLNLSLGKLDLASTTSAPLALSLKSPGLVEDLAIRGTLAASPNAIQLEAEATATGLSTSLPAAYLPPGIDSALDNGTLSVSTSLALTRAAPNSLAAALALRDFDFRAQNAPEPLAHLISADLDISSLNTLTHDLNIKRVSAQGFSAAAITRPDGSLSLLGLTIGTPLTAQPDPNAAATTTTATPALASNKPAPKATDLLTASKRPPPLMTIDAIDLSLSRLSYTGPAPATPIALVNATLKSAAPFQLLGKTAETNAPAKLNIEASVDHFIRSISITAETAPFATEPSLAATLSAAGINTTQLTQVIPALAPILDGSSLTDGTFNTKLSATAKVQRRGPTIDWSRGAAVTLTVDGTEFRQQETLLAGVKRVRADNIRLDPASGNITFPEIEVDSLSGNAWRDQSGIHIFGLTLRPPTSTTPEPVVAEQPATPAPQTAQAPSTNPTATPSTPPSSPEVRIDRLLAAGLDFKFEDRAVNPPVTIPFNSLEAEVRGLSSALLTRERPIRFNATVGAGRVQLPGKAPGSIEERDFFSQCFANGTLAMYPAPRGRAIVSISGLELAALRGIAQDAGASIGGGVFDARISIRGQDDNTLLTSSKFVLTDLRYAEPDDGPVKRFMVLPMPVNVAIAAIEAPDATITISPEFSIDQRGLSTSKLIAAGAAAAGQVIATAVLSSPAKVVGGVANLFGGDDKSFHWVDDPPISLTYPTGVTTLPNPSVQSLRDVIQLARTRTDIQVNIEHKLGAADNSMSMTRANPPTDQAVALAEDLRRRRASLIRERSELLSPAAALTLGITTDAAARDRLRELSLSLADLDDSMDQLYALQAPGSDSMKARRTRNAAWELIDARIAAIRREINTHAGTDGLSRIVLGGARPVLSDSDSSQLIIRIKRKVPGPAPEAAPSASTDSTPPPTSPASDAQSSGPASSHQTAPDAPSPPNPAAPTETPSPRP